MSALPSYQNVHLAPGRHASPADGVCAMELVSMLAEEPFSDRPITACPVLGALLRAYNDVLPGRYRADLLASASSVVGSRCPAAEPARVRRMVAFAVECYDAQPRWRRMLDPHARGRLLKVAEGPFDSQPLGFFAMQVARLLRHAPDGRARALALVEELVAIAPASPQMGEASAAAVASNGL